MRYRVRRALRYLYTHSVRMLMLRSVGRYSARSRIKYILRHALINIWATSREFSRVRNSILKQYLHQLHGRPALTSLKGHAVARARRRSVYADLKSASRRRTLSLTLSVFRRYTKLWRRRMNVIYDKLASHQTAILRGAFRRLYRRFRIKLLKCRLLFGDAKLPMATARERVHIAPVVCVLVLKRALQHLFKRSRRQAATQKRYRQVGHIYRKRLLQNVLYRCFYQPARLKEILTTFKCITLKTREFLITCVRFLRVYSSRKRRLRSQIDPVAERHDAVTSKRRVFIKLNLSAVRNKNIRSRQFIVSYALIKEYFTYLRYYSVFRARFHILRNRFHLLPFVSVWLSLTAKRVKVQLVN